MIADFKKGDKVASNTFGLMEIVEDTAYNSMGEKVRLEDRHLKPDKNIHFMVKTAKTEPKTFLCARINIHRLIVQYGDVLSKMGDDKRYIVAGIKMSEEGAISVQLAIQGMQVIAIDIFLSKLMEGLISGEYYFREAELI